MSISQLTTRAKLRCDQGEVSEGDVNTKERESTIRPTCKLLYTLKRTEAQQYEFIVFKHVSITMPEPNKDAIKEKICLYPQLVKNQAKFQQLAVQQNVSWTTTVPDI